MARKLSPAAQAAIAAFRIARETGLSETDAWVLARQAVGPAWTRSLATVVTRRLVAEGLKSEDRRGGNQQDPLSQAVFGRLRAFREEIGAVRGRASEELEIGMVPCRAADGTISWDLRWHPLWDGGDAIRDAERLSHRPGRPPSNWRRHVLDGTTAAAVAALEDRRRVIDFWAAELDAIRSEAWADIRAMLAAAPDSARGWQLWGRARLVIFGRRTNVEAPDIVWRADPPYPQDSRFVTFDRHGADDTEDDESRGDESRSEEDIAQKWNRHGKRWTTRQAAMMQ